MPGARAAMLPGGTRLHLQHGPIDLILGADGHRAHAFAAAEARFATILQDLVDELPQLRQPHGPAFRGATAQRMAAAVAPHAARVFVTPMAAVAGAVADTVLAAMVLATPLRRAYVNNGGDIALHLAPGQSFRMAMAGLDNSDLGRIAVASGDPVRGIATSGQGGRSLSLGIAESVTVLARSAAEADVAATLIANAVDLPDHPAIRRSPAHEIDPDSDLGARAVVTHTGPLSPSEVDAALDAGLACANDMLARGLIAGAALFLRGRSCSTGLPQSLVCHHHESIEHA